MVKTCSNGPIRFFFKQVKVKERKVNMANQPVLQPPLCLSMSTAAARFLPSLRGRNLHFPNGASLCRTTWTSHKDRGMHLNIAFGARSPVCFRNFDVFCVRKVSVQCCRCCRTWEARSTITRRTSSFIPRTVPSSMNATTTTSLFSI